MSDTLKTPAFSVIIVNFNGGDYVQGALDSLSKQTFRDFEVILVDNASTDNSVDALQTDDLPAFKLMKQDDNLGFAAANNLAAKHAHGRWLALLNPDAEANPDWLQKVSASQSRYPNISHFACAQYEMHRSGYLDGAGDAYLIFGIPWRGGFGLPTKHLPTEGTCFSPCGASAIIRRDVFDAHNGFDERFFCYCEDVDLGFRMQLAGQTCVFLPDCIVVHAGGGLSSKVSDFSTIHGTRNRIWTYWKNMPALLLLLTLPGHIAISAYILLRGAMTGNAGPTLKGMRAGIKGISGLRRDNSPWQRPRRTVSLWHLSRTMAWNPLRISARMPHVRPIGAASNAQSQETDKR